MKTMILKDEDIPRVVADMALCSRLVPTVNKMRVAEALGDSEVIPRMPEPACQAGPIAPALSSPLCLATTDTE